jgi:DNA-directed RNA polymerase specialized sigma24 family protein
MLSRLPPAEPVTDHAPAVLDRVAGGDREYAIRRAFSTLSYRDQEVLSPCVFEELGTAATSTALGVLLGTDKSRPSRAKARLADVLGADPTFPTNLRSRS